MKKHKRFLAVACVFIMAVSFHGCARSNGILPPQYIGSERQNDGRIGVVAARFQPQVKVDVLTSGKGAGAGKGAGEGALQGAIQGLQCIQFLWPPLVALCYAAIITVGATTGAIAGAVITESSEKIAAGEAAMKNRLEALKMQEILRDQVIEYAKEVEYTGLSVLKDQGPEDMKALPAYRPATGERLDTVVELSLLSLEAVVTGAKGNFISVMAIFRVRVVNASDGKVLDGFIHRSIATRTYDEWMKDNARMLGDVIQTWYREFAEAVVDEFFLNYRPAGEAAGKTAQKETKKADTYSWEPPIILAEYILQPLYPLYGEVRPGSPSLYPPSGWYKVLEVDGSEPTFRWEAFPKLKELRDASAGARITDVKYDLRIFNFRYGDASRKYYAVNKQVYQATGLTEPKFMLSGFFKPCYVYFWTVRARFLLDGTRQATEWSGTYYGMDVRPWWWRRGGFWPNSFYYFPFRVPAASPGDKCPKILNEEPLKPKEQKPDTVIPAIKAEATKQPVPQAERGKEVAYVPKESVSERKTISLRSQSDGNFSQSHYRALLQQYNFFDNTLNKNGSFQNDFVDNGNGTITDRATGLMWQQKGSSRELYLIETEGYIRKLNRDGFAGYSDWRIPTTEEIVSLMRQKNRRWRDLHIDPLFDKTQYSCWSSDVGILNISTGHYNAWFVSFEEGTAQQVMTRNSVQAGTGASQNPDWRSFSRYVRAVRKK